MVFITGASSGIGKAVATKFAELKKDLILVARRKSALDTLATELKDRHGVNVHPFYLDVSDKNQVEVFAKENATLLSQVTVLVNNAGLAKGMGPLQQGSIEDWEMMISTNLLGLLYVTRAQLGFFVKKKAGHVINLGSVAGHLVYPNGNVYCATKHAVHALNQAMRIDMVGLGIRVTEISPGMVETEFSEVRFGDKEKAKNVYRAMAPLVAEDVADAVVWAATRPGHVNIQEIVMYPTAQASPTLVHRNE